MNREFLNRKWYHILHILDIDNLKTLNKHYIVVCFISTFMKNKILLLLPLILISCATDQKNKKIVITPDTTDITKSYGTSDFRKNIKSSDINLKTEAQWDSVNELKKHYKHESGYRRHKDYKTFGWHMYSEGSAYKNYDFSLLWGISYFSYTINPRTGSYHEIHQWKTTNLVDSAKANNCKVFLSVTNFGAKNNATFLANPKAQETLIDSVSALLKLRDADGVNIDFEGVSKKNKQEFSNFLVNLSTKLRNDNSKYQISLALYAVDGNRIFDIKTIDPYINFYTMMGYDYYGSFSHHAGPIAPLKSSTTWGKNSLEHSVNYYIEQGVQPSKLIVGLPYYGGEWQTNTESIPGKVIKFTNHYTYDQIKKKINSLRLTPTYDANSATAYVVYKDTQGKDKQIWFDDSLSLSSKYDWMKSKNIAGIGIWALGYDRENKELWELLADKFGQEK